MEGIVSIVALALVVATVLAQENCYTGDGRGYRGRIAVTQRGVVCQRWDAQSPQRHDRTPERYPRSGLESNFCRNPDGEARPWCYTTSSKRWDFCSVPLCSTLRESCYIGDGREYRGKVAITQAGVVCQRWAKQTPQKHDRTPEKYPSSGLVSNYCRNPDGEARPWCYTTSSGKRWDFCPVPLCTAPTYSCYEGNGQSYRGSQRVTASNKNCQRWDAQYPQRHDRTAENYPDAGLESNYCRNPDAEARPWCYTTVSGSRWEFCSVPKC